MSKATSRQERLNENQNQEQLPEQPGFNDDLPNPEDMDFTQDFKGMDFDSLKDKTGEPLTGDFLKLETLDGIKGGKNFFVTGHTTFPDNVTGERKPAVKLVGEGNQVFICGATVVVRACDNIEKFPKPIRIIVDGKIKSPKGSYWNAQVLAL